MNSLQPDDFPCCVKCQQPNPLRKERGFTLIELIMVIVILGVLAVFAAPKLFDSNSFTGRGFHDETSALLRFGQKTAIAQRRTVCVTVNATGVTMTMFVTNPAPATCAAATAAQAPPLTPPFIPQGGTGLTTVPSPLIFQFTPLGSTDQASPIAITVANSTPITIEPSTGYVHD
jgi:MSHA pilin protein MshC